MVPVCHVLDDGRIYFGSGRDATKVRNLQKDPRVALVVDLYAEDWDSIKGAMVQGRATLIRGGPKFRKVRALLYKKYPQYPLDSALDESDSVIVEVTPVHLSNWGVE